MGCMSSQDLQQESCDLPGSPWPHRWAWVLACGVFPLIWMGGLVTTYEAGMSVPDWPTTYHSWFYPLQKWLWNFNDLFLEHSHRTIAQIDGIIAIILIVLIWRWEPRKSVRWLAVAILVGLISQGVLGGLRVVLDERDCMVDISRYFLRFTQDQSCGKCTLCRIGTRRMREILDRIAELIGKYESV